MARAKQIFDDVLEAQRLLGTGEVDEALARAEPLRDRARDLLRSPTLTSFERTYAGAAFTYATVTLVLGTAEVKPPAEAVPAVRALATEAVADGAPGIRMGVETWKILAAAAEMLARAGDAHGAVWAVRKARELAPDQEYMTQLHGSIKSMYPAVFAEIADPAPQEPPPLAAK